MKVTRSKGGRRLAEIQAPHIWHVAMRIKESDAFAADQMLECWHDLLAALQKIEREPKK